MPSCGRWRPSQAEFSLLDAGSEVLQEESLREIIPASCAAQETNRHELIFLIFKKKVEQAI